MVLRLSGRRSRSACSPVVLPSNLARREESRMGTAIRHQRRFGKRLLLSALGASLLAVSDPAAQNANGPSAFCHSTDGAFTMCPGGGAEWSDVPAKSFPESHSFLYASQADLDPAKG
jgi:hypothetical protein